MKARFFALVALVLGMASCAKDFAPEVQVGGEVDFTLSVAAPELTATRADADGLIGHDSAYGAIDYLTDDDWKDVDLRYILEVYDVADSYVDAKPIKDRMVKVFDKYEPTTFELRLVPGRNYRFVVFADFVEEGASATATVAAQENTGKRHIIGETLADIRIKDIADYEAEGKEAEKFLNNEYSDAYFGVMNYKPEHGTHNNNTKDNGEPLTLKRPYAKVRVVATDLHEVNLNVEPKSVAVNYIAKRPMAFNALTGNISVVEESVNREYTRDYAAISKDQGGLENHYYNAGYDANKAENLVKNDAGVYRQKYMTLFTDYILATDSQSAIQFTMSVFDGNEGLIKSTNFNTQIPVQRNHLTTIIGNVLTTANQIDVRIDDNFANADNPFDAPFYQELWDGESATAPEVDPEDPTGKTRLIDQPSELAWLAAAVNGTLVDTRAAANTFAGMTFKLTADVNLNNEIWTPIGAAGRFEGTFDGQGHTVYNLCVQAEPKKFAGLFASCKGATIKNVNVENATVTSNYTSGVIVAHAICTNIENCHVYNAVVTSTPYNNDDANNVGVIAGYLCADGGNKTANLTGCSVNNAEVVAYRDVAGIVGTANQADGGRLNVTGNTIENAIVVADQTAKYGSTKVANVAAVAGRILAGAVVENNTVNNVEAYVLVNSADALSYQANNAAQDVVIRLAEDIVGNASIVQKKDIDVVVDGCDNKYDGTIVFDGEGRQAGAETFTFKNIAFVPTATSIDVINAYNAGAGRKYNYAHNVTIDNCSLVGGENAILAKFHQAKNVAIKNCNVESGHSLAQLYGCDGVTIEKVVVKADRGIALGTSKDCVIKNTTIDVKKYGVRVDATTSYAITTTIENSSIKAAQPVAVRKSIEGTDCSVVLSNVALETTDRYDVVFTSDKDEDVYTVPAGKINVDGAAEGCVIYPYDVVVKSAEELQAALDVNFTNIFLGADINGDVTNVQKPDVKVVIDGRNHNFAGCILVDGKSQTYRTAGLTIKNVNFNAESISADACINLGNKTNINATRYTCNVTVDSCTFDVPGAVAVKSYTGGDKNLVITNCTATAAAHSLLQAKGIDGILVEKCTVNSKNGLNFNNSTNVVINNCKVVVRGYAARFGEGSKANDAEESYSINDSKLQSTGEEGDAVIVLRGTADKSTLTISNTELIGGEPKIENTANANVVYL